MNVIGIAIGVTGLLLLGMFMWMLALSVRKKRLDQERKQKEIAYRKAVERNRRQEKEERVMKAEGGHIPTILYLAKEAERSKPKEALYWYTKAAKLDSVTGMYGIVRISNKMKQDVILKEQAKFWQTCIHANEGSLAHKYEMGQALIYGRGTEVNEPKAIAVLEAAASQNHIESLIFLGDWWAPDQNNDPQMSTAYYRKATELKSNAGRMKLGLNYIHGVGVASSFSTGVYWLERAAEKGYLEAMYKVGEVWMDHKPNGNSISYIWLFLAAQLGYEPARTLRDQVALKIGVDTVVGLQGLSKPMIKKIRDNKVSKHSIIKALNRLYKRGIPIPDGEVTKSTKQTQDAILEETQAEQGDKIVADVDQSSMKNPLDFSQSPMDKSS